MAAYRRKYRDPETGQTVVEPRWRYRCKFRLPVCIACSVVPHL